MDTRPGKRLHKYGEIHQFLMGKITMSMAMFNSKLLNYQRVSGWWYTHPSKKKYESTGMMKYDEIPNIWKVLKSHKVPWFQSPP